MTSAATPAIQFRNVSRWYGNVVAVNDVTFDVGPGVTGLLGPNGAGKSTILHIMAGLLRPSAGEVHVLGQPAWRNPNIYRHIGLVPEREAVYSFLTGRQFVELAAHLHRLPDPARAAARAIDLVDMAPAASRPTGDYSKGMKQRIKIAAALVHDPQILILDEPFNGADPRQRLQLTDLFRTMAREGRTILYSSHILEEVERLADTVLVIVAGRLAASGDFRQIRALMTDRPHTFTVRSSDDRALAAHLLAEPSIRGVALEDGVLEVRADELLAAARALPAAARQAGVTIHEVRPTDESLESVFSYLVRR
ncbi:ABC transporter ATP-binding protein [Tepidiforma sp.]|uniref:ABC transporter ATP-binding protein n=1 Tax=Tepidiforma sp. TaxID=2682230 RepID=UPI002ADDE356|nr:ABC transporter ATP-binding protein [Tepidiforma sp.]